MAIPQYKSETGSQVGPAKIDSKEFTGGVEAGYNWQSGMVVYGLETDFEYFHLKGTTVGTGVYPCCAPTGFTVTSEAHTDWLFTVRPRIGIACCNASSAIPICSSAWIPRVEIAKLIERPPTMFPSRGSARRS